MKIYKMWIQFWTCILVMDVQVIGVCFVMPNNYDFEKILIKIKNKCVK